MSSAYRGKGGNGGASRKGQEQEVDPNKIFNQDIREQYLKRQYLQRTTGDPIEKQYHVKSIFNLQPKPKDGAIKRGIKWVVNPFGKPFLVMQVGGTALLAYYMLFSLDFGGKYDDETVLKPIREWHKRKMEQWFSLSDREKEVVRLREKKEKEIQHIIDSNRAPETQAIRIQKKE